MELPILAIVAILIITFLLIQIDHLKVHIKELRPLIAPIMEDSITLSKEAFESLGWIKDKTIKDREFYSYSVEKHTDGVIHYTTNYTLSYNEVTGETLLYIISISSKTHIFRGILSNKSDLRHLMEIAINYESN